jgi:hypothetical protein
MTRPTAVSDVVRWACRSPLRLAAFIAVPITLLFVAAAVTAQSGAGHNEPADSPAVHAADVPDAVPYVDAAVTFVESWAVLAPGQDAEDWRATVSSLATADLAAGLALTDTTSLPGTRPQGRPEVRFVAEDSALVIVPLESTDRVAVTVVRDQDRWLVSDIQPDVGDHGASG